LILYLDTSALVKLYAEAEAVATSVVAYAEVRAALARKLREGAFSFEEHREAVEALDEDWKALDTPEATDDLVRRAGGLAEEHALRGFDAIHLASALLVREAYSEQTEAPAEEAVFFFGFDLDLTEAAGKVMRMYEQTEDPKGQSRS
jgi:predicted nucleic acid-binding protein